MWIQNLKLFLPMNSNKISNSDTIASIMAMNVTEESKPKLLILPRDSNVYQQMLYGTIGSRFAFMF